MESDRVFYSLLERVGGAGRYQTVSLVIMSSMMLIVGATSFFNVFLYYQEDYTCSDSSINCHQYVCSLPASERLSYVHEDFKSMASHFGDYRCEEEAAQLDVLQSFPYIGGAVGLIAGALINEILTKRQLLIITVVGNITGVLIAIFGPTILVSSIGLFINMAAISIQLELIACVITETVQEELRGGQIVIPHVIEGMGISLNGLFFFMLKDWQIFLATYILIPLLFSLWGLVFYMEETPFDLIINNTAEFSLAALKRIAVKNGRENEHKITLQELQNIKNQYSDNEQQKHDYVISILDLFRYDSLRMMTILGILIHFLSSYQFFAPELALKEYSLNIYFNGILIGSSGVCACILSYFIVDHYKRKMIIYISEIICLCISVPVFVFFSCTNSQECTPAMQIAQSIGLFLFGFAATITYNFFYMIQYESFPNQIRGLALQITCVSAFFAAAIVPHLMTFFQNIGISIISTYILIGVLIILSMIKMPETFGIPPPQMIQELKYQSKNAKQLPIEDKIKNT